MPLRTLSAGEQSRASVHDRRRYGRLSMNQPESAIPRSLAVGARRASRPLRRSRFSRTPVPPALRQHTLRQDSASRGVAGMGHSRTGLKLENTSRTNFGGLGLEDAVLEHIPRAWSGIFVYGVQIPSTEHHHPSSPRLVCGLYKSLNKKSHHSRTYRPFCG